MAQPGGGTTETTRPASPAEVAADAVDEQLAARLVEWAKTEGTSLVGPDGCCTGSPTWCRRTRWRAN